MMQRFLDLKYAHPVSVDSETGERTRETDTLRIQSVRSSRQRWDLLIALEPITDVGAALGRLASHRARHGSHTAFDMPMPQISGYETPSNVTGVVRVAANYDAGIDSIQISTQPITEANVEHIRNISPGTFVKFTNHEKIYQISVSDTAAPSNRSILDLFPPLVSEVAAGLNLDFEPNIRVRYDPDAPTIISTDTRGASIPRIAVIEDL